MARADFPDIRVRLVDGFFMSFAFTRIGDSCADDAHRITPFYKTYQEQSRSCGIPSDDLSKLSDGVIRVVMNATNWIEKHRGSLFEGYTMLPQVRLRLRGIPTELHAESIRPIRLTRV